MHVKIFFYSLLVAFVTAAPVGHKQVDQIKKLKDGPRTVDSKHLQYFKGPNKLQKETIEGKKHPVNGEHRGPLLQKPIADIKSPIYKKPSKSHYKDTTQTKSSIADYRKLDKQRIDHKVQDKKGLIGKQSKTTPVIENFKRKHLDLVKQDVDHQRKVPAGDVQHELLTKKNWQLKRNFHNQHENDPEDEEAERNDRGPPEDDTDRRIKEQNDDDEGHGMDQIGVPQPGYVRGHEANEVGARPVGHQGFAQGKPVIDAVGQQAQGAVQWAKDAINRGVQQVHEKVQLDDPLKDIHLKDVAEAAGANIRMQIPERPEMLKAEAVRQQIARLQALLEKMTLPQLNKNELKPADHLDGVRLEQDGHLNKDYLKEVFIGNHEEFDTETRKKKVLRLKDIMFLMDLDHDGLLTPQELRSWIQAKVHEHLMEAADETHKLFQLMDLDKDGGISWQEFLTRFYMAHDVADKEAIKMAETEDSKVLDDHDREEMLHHRYRWSAADKNDDQRLSPDEFMSFRHPESNVETLRSMAKDMIQDHDSDQNGELTRKEFVNFVPLHGQDPNDSEIKQQIQDFAKQRAKEFLSIDSDKNGIATLQEVMEYLDPHNEAHAVRESEYLFSVMDDNEDRRLSYDEILKHKDVFLDSKAMSAGKNFHDEF